MARRRKGGGPLVLWADVMASGVATAVTLSVRVPQLLSGTMSAAESRRMVAEKAAAAAEGAAAGSRAAARVAARRLARPAPMRALDDLAEIAEAATRPARRRVKANAERLSRRPKA